MSVFLGIGHGRRPDGTFDPGAVNPLDGSVEHALAAVVVEAAAAALRRSHVSVHAERSGGDALDPDYHGSIRTVNAGDYDCALEVHFDWWRGARGLSPLYLSDEGERLGDCLLEAFADAKLPVHGPVYRPRLAFLRLTRSPAVIAEIDRVQRQSAGALTRRGEALAEGVCAWLGVPYVPL